MFESLDIQSVIDTIASEQAEHIKTHDRYKQYHKTSETGFDWEVFEHWRENEIGYTIFATTMWLKVRSTIFIGLVVHTSVTIGSLFLPTWGFLVPIMLSGLFMLIVGLLLYYRLIGSRSIS